MKKNLNRMILGLVGNVLDHALNLVLSRLFYMKEINKIMKMLSISNKKVKEEDLWYAKWKRIGVYVNRKYYRVFSKFLDPMQHDLTNICPDDICHNYIEPLLNPIRYRSYYSDKNEFDKIIGGGNFPQTVLRNQNGCLMNADYEALDRHSIDISQLTRSNDLVVKPSIDSASGNGVRFFHRSEEDGLFHDVESDEIMNVDMLDVAYPNNNYIVQERARQSEFMSKFCPTSINTLRIQVYRSLSDNKTYVINMILRIGRNGSLVDNAHAGGAFIGIESGGKFMKHLLDQYGRKYTIFNGIDFSKENFFLPNFEEIVSFAKSIGGKIHHARLIALDVMLDEHNQPKLIEYNIDSFGLWLFQFTTGTAFGQWTDEIIEYVRRNMNRATKLYFGV